MLREYIGASPFHRAAVDTLLKLNIGYASFGWLPKGPVSETATAPVFAAEIPARSARHPQPGWGRGQGPGRRPEPGSAPKLQAGSALGPHRSHPAVRAVIDTAFRRLADDRRHDAAAHG